MMRAAGALGVDLGMLRSLEGEVAKEDARRVSGQGRWSRRDDREEGGSSSVSDTSRDSDYGVDQGEEESLDGSTSNENDDSDDEDGIGGQIVPLGNDKMNPAQDQGNRRHSQLAREASAPPPRWENIVDSLPPDVHSLTIPGVNSGWVFRFRVVAKNDRGWGLRSQASSSVLTPPAPQVVRTWRRDCNRSGARIGWATPDFPFLRMLRRGIRRVLSGEDPVLGSSRGARVLRERAAQKWHDLQKALARETAVRRGGQSGSGNESKIEPDLEDLVNAEVDIRFQAGTQRKRSDFLDGATEQDVLGEQRAREQRSRG